MDALPRPQTDAIRQHRSITDSLRSQVTLDGGQNENSVMRRYAIPNSVRQRPRAQKAPFTESERRADRCDAGEAHDGDPAGSAA